MPRHFKHWLDAYIEYTRDMESPLNFHFWTGIATIAGALRRRVWIDMRKFIWTPNFYIILVAPAGIAAKSTSISIGMDLLLKLPTEAGIRFGPESMTWQKLADSLAESTEFVKYLDLKGRQSLQPMSAITCGVSELGTFLTMDDDKLLSFLIRMWDGGDATFTHSTKASGDVEVRAPWLNVIAATTPSWLSQNFPPVMIGGGLASRIIFIHETQKRALIPYPDEMQQDIEHERRKKELIDDLYHISQLAGPYFLNEEARIWGRAWYINHHHGGRPIHMASERYSGYIARKQTHLHKVAMVVAASRRDELFIDISDLIEAERIINIMEKQMLKTFESIGQNEIANAILEIRSFISAQPGKRVRQDILQLNSFRNLRPKQLEEALSHGTNMGIFAIGSDNGIPVINLTEKAFTI